MHHIINEAVPSDNILFLINEDMHFTDVALKHCRSIPIQGKQVYYPVAFGQYDPDIIEKGMPPGKPKDINKRDHSKFTGGWLYDHTNAFCGYRDDFTRVLTTLFSTDSNLEGVLPMTYNVFLQTNVAVVNAVEPGLYRRHSTAMCETKPVLSETEQDYCTTTKASQLGSKPALGIVYLTEIVDKNV